MSNFMSPDDSSFWIHYIESIELVEEEFKEDHSKENVNLYFIFEYF